MTFKVVKPKCLLGANSSALTELLLGCSGSSPFCLFYKILQPHGAGDIYKTTSTLLPHQSLKSNTKNNGDKLATGRILSLQ
jgi:hypothetical protein